MPTATNSPQPQPTENHLPVPTAQPTAVPQEPIDPPPPSEPQSQPGKKPLVMLPSAAFTDRLRKAETKGRNALLAELDQQAQGLGYANHAAMMQHLRPNGQNAKPNGNNRPTAKPTVQQQPSSNEPQPPRDRNDRKAMSDYRRDHARWNQAQRENERLQRELQAERSKRRKAERTAQATEARAELERIAARVGITNTDYAIHLFYQAHQAKSEEELAQVDEAKFFEGLRPRHPYLFSEVVVPATTGTTGPTPGSNGGPPKPRDTASAAGNQGAIDVRNMSRQEYEQYKAKRGIRSAPTGTRL